MLDHENDQIFFLNKRDLKIISSKLPFIECHVRFTTIPFKPLSEQVIVDILINIYDFSLYK